MDHFATPIRHIKSTGDLSKRIIKKQQLLNLISSIDFDHVAISVVYSTSNDENDIEVFFNEICSALSRVLIKQSPPKSTPRKLLKRNVDLSSSGTRDIDSPLKSKSTYIAKSTTDRATKTAIKGYTSNDDTQNIATTSTNPKSTPFNLPPIDEDIIIEQMCQVQPWNTVEGLKEGLPHDPVERDYRLRLYADIIPYLSDCMSLSCCLLINIAKASSSGHVAFQERFTVPGSLFGPDRLPDIDPKDMELFEAAAREEKDVNPKLFTCIDVTRKVTHDLPFVINGYFHFGKSTLPIFAASNFLTIAIPLLNKDIYRNSKVPYVRP
jgi:hypothetical protein